METNDVIKRRIEAVLPMLDSIISYQGFTSQMSLFVNSLP